MRIVKHRLVSLKMGGHHGPINTWKTRNELCRYSRSLSRSFRREQSWNFLHHAHVNPGEFNTRLNVRERYADLRRQFITHFKADDAESVRGGCIRRRRFFRSRAKSREIEADYRVRSRYLHTGRRSIDSTEEIASPMIGVRKKKGKRSATWKRGEEFGVRSKANERASDIAVNQNPVTGRRSRTETAKGGGSRTKSRIKIGIKRYYPTA